jgi:hypothetical protein
MKPWPAGGDHDQLKATSVETMSSAVSLLANLSTLTQTDLMARVESRFEAGLLDKVLIFRCYDDMLTEWRKDDAIHVGAEPPGEPPPPRPGHPELDWPSGPGPGYSHEAAVEALTNRYRNLTAMTSATLPHLNALPEFQNCVEVLRERGWLDWHILGAVLAIAQSYRVNRELNAGRMSMEDARKIHYGTEAADDPVPVSEFGLEALTSVHEINNYTTLVRTWDRPVHLRMVPHDAIDRLLADRYRHYDDDIDHAEPFCNP